MAEWLMATDCKSVLLRVRGFESFSSHQLLIMKLCLLSFLIYSFFLTNRSVYILYIPGTDTYFLILL